MKVTLFTILLLLIVVAGFNACQSNKAPAPVVVVTPIDSASYTYNLKIRDIFLVNCTIGACHNAGAAQAGVVLDSYASSVSSTKTKKVLCSIERGPGCQQMPQNRAKLPDSTINAVRVWIARGYPE